MATEGNLSYFWWLWANNNVIARLKYFWQAEILLGSIIQWEDIDVHTC
jgi:hypothetical protein